MICCGNYRSRTQEELEVYYRILKTVWEWFEFSKSKPILDEITLVTYAPRVHEHLQMNLAFEQLCQEKSVPLPGPKQQEVGTLDFQIINQEKPIENKSKQTTPAKAHQVSQGFLSKDGPPESKVPFNK